MLFAKSSMLTLKSHKNNNFTTINIFVLPRTPISCKRAYVSSLFVLRTKPERRCLTGACWDRYLVTEGGFVHYRGGWPQRHLLRAVILSERRKNFSWSWASSPLVLAWKVDGVDQFLAYSFSFLVRTSPNCWGEIQDSSYTDRQLWLINKGFQ